MGWNWATATPNERGNFVRQYTALGREELQKQFGLSERGVDAILSGQPWRPEYDDDYVRREEFPSLPPAKAGGE